MNDRYPDLRTLNLVVRDMVASVDFYRMLGLPAPPAEDAPGPHVELASPSGFSLELDTAESVRHWHAGWRADPASVTAVIGFQLESSASVDRLYQELTAAGHAGRQPPFDAFWGGRYAIVADPDGNDVALIGPIEAGAPSA